MTEAATPVQYRQKLNPNAHRSNPRPVTSRVQDTVQKFNRIGKLNENTSPPPPPLPPHRPMVPIANNRKITFPAQETPPSSLSSSGESMVPLSHSDPDRRRVHHPSAANFPRRTTNGPRHSRVQTAQESPKRIARRSPPPPPIPPKTRQIHRSQSANTTRFAPYVNRPRYVDEEEMSGSFEMYEQEDVDNEVRLEFPKRHHNRTGLWASSPLQSDFNRRASLMPFAQQRFNDESSPPRHRRRQNSDVDSIGLEIGVPVTSHERRVIMERRFLADRNPPVQGPPSTIADYDATEMPPPDRRRPPPPDFALPYLNGNFPEEASTSKEDLQVSTGRTLSWDNFMMEIGALLTIFIITMILVLAIRAEQPTLRTIMQLTFCYVYLVSIVWMIWCTADISRFRRQWMEYTKSATNEDEYMDLATLHNNEVFYFPNANNTGGLFMRVGAGLLCMGSLILTIVEAIKAIAEIRDTPTSRQTTMHSGNSAVGVTKTISYVFRFFFHCLQYTFLFRYGNLVINRYHSIARVGLVHLTIANFCTWFDAIVFETLEQLHKCDKSACLKISEKGFFDESLFLNVTNYSSATATNSTGSSQTTLQLIIKIEEALSVYLYPCLIEYSLISLTVFLIMWKNIGQREGGTYISFGRRHIFTINCSRASRGLFIGAVIVLLTILTLVPIYLLDSEAHLITQITELVLLTVALVFVCFGFFHTTKLYFDEHAHVDAFDRVLIIITTVGDFAYSLFGLIASLFIERAKLPSGGGYVGMEIAIGFVAIFQTFLQSGFILDTLKRRVTDKAVKTKPGREAVTTLLLTNLAIWLHDSFSAKKVLLNCFQVSFYDCGTWAIIQAFTSPLSIFYRFHSAVCLADIWQETFRDTSSEGDERTVGKIGMTRLSAANRTPRDH